MRRLLIVPLAVLTLVLTVGGDLSAQSLSFSFFERYLESLRIEAGIPGLSATVLQNDEVVWEQSFGRQDLETQAIATGTTPYVLGNLSQVIGATLVLKKCVDEGSAEISDSVVEWTPQFPDGSSTIRDVLTHAVPAFGFRYDVTRFAALTAVVEACAQLPYRQVLVEDVFERLGMEHSVPGHSIAALTVADGAALGAARLGHYATVLRNLAVPYRVDARSGSATRSVLEARPADTAAGIVSTVRDLARFDVALNRLVLLDRPTRDLAWTQASPLPTGLGWFVQAYNGEPIVWQFGLVEDAYSSLILKVPNRRLTLILLANSDGLSAPFGLGRGDVTASLFARLFLRLLVV